MPVPSPDKRGGFIAGLTTQHGKTDMVTNTSTTENTGTLKTRRPRLRKMDNRFSMRFGTWNIQTMLQAGKMMEVGDVLCRYNLDLIALQEVRWSGTGQIEKQNFTFYYSGATKQGLYGTGFMVGRKLKPSILGFEPISDRLCSIRVKGKLYNSTFICCYAPINDAADETKDQFYGDLQNVIEKVPRYDALIVLGDVNAQVGKEQAFGEVAGKHSLHDVTNDNGERLCFFAAANNLFISSTNFPHKAIHKGTWKVPGTDRVNQIDHILSSKRRMSNILDVRSYRGANCDSDHFLVVARARFRTQTVQCKSERRIRWATEKLKDGEINTKYKQEIAKQLELRLPQSDIELEWKSIKDGILEAAKETIGEKQRVRPEEWYDEECREALERKNAARLIYLQSKSSTHKEKFKEERDKARRLLKRKKKASEVRQMQALDDAGTRGSVRTFFKKVNPLRKGFQPRINICRDGEGNALTDKTEILKRWREYFDNLLNVGSEAADRITFYDVEQEINPPTVTDVEKCIKYLKNNKASDFKQAFDSVNRHKIFDAMRLLGIPSKLVRLVEATMCNSKSVVAIQNDISDPFEIRSGVRQGDALSTVVFNLTLEAAIRNVGVKGLLDYNTSQLAAYADDIVITSRSQSSMIRHTTTLQMEAAKYGLMVNASKTKYLHSTRNPRPLQDVTIGDDTIEGVSSFKYLGSILSSRNKVGDEVNARIMAGSGCFYSLSKLFRSKYLSAKSKLSIYKTIIRPVTTYGCEAWSLTALETQKLAVFERKVLRKVFGPVKDADGDYRIRMNHELEALMNRETIVRFIKSQRLRWAGHSLTKNIQQVDEICPIEELKHFSQDTERWLHCLSLKDNA
ncbi:unnamed protein product [Danaus chrysippus]|uniref:(African queen) hypothetical protein n=1 Tax=Danaus chrysippus TaxID=151541 RepID=A0A8J2R134_9NEOP|nr:unnamed protein product [Danaus chrysippus]